MEKEPIAIRAPVKRAQAENYLLIMLIAFAASVTATRMFLQVTGYPRLGNSTLHIAHALWGGLLLMISGLLPLMLQNRWAFNASAVLNGLGTGLFIDEVGKFITQNNNYFYPPAAPLIYAFFLLLVLVYLFVRRPEGREPRGEFYRALTDLYELADNNLDRHELSVLRERLGIAQKSYLPHVARLAGMIEGYLDESKIPLVPVRPGLSKRVSAWLRRQGERVGRPRLRLLILLGMGMMAFEVIFALVFLVYAIFSPTTTLQGFLQVLINRADSEISASNFWFFLHISLEMLIGLLSLASIYLILRGKEYEGVHLGLLGLLLSLTGLLLLTFYLDQFGALSMAFTQFPFLLLVLAYRRWYLVGSQRYRQPGA